jgi:hypothetical protein
MGVIQTDIPDYLTKAGLTGDIGTLRNLITGDKDFALPLRQKSVGELGVICSVDMATAFFRNAGIPIEEIQNLKTFEKGLAATLESEQDAGQAVFVTLNQKRGNAAGGFVFYRGPNKEELINFSSGYSNGYTKRLQRNIPVITELNADHPHIDTVMSRELRGKPEMVLPTLDMGGAVVQKDRRFAALNRANALNLKAVMFPYNGHVIQDARVSDANQRFGEILEAVESGKMFARIHLTDRWDNSTARNMTIIPGYALEFLEFDESGIVTGFKDTSEVQINLTMDTTADTDFTEKTRFRINGTEGQLAIVERALSKLRKTNETITVQGQKRKLIEDGKERRIHGTQGHIKFDTRLGVSFRMNAYGEAQDFIIGCGRKNSLIKHAISMPQVINMVFRGRNYRLDPT